MELPPRVIAVDETLTLRAFEGQTDLPEFLQVIEESLAHLRPWMPWVAEHSLDNTMHFLARRAELWESGEEYSYAIVLDGAIAGSCGLFQRDETREDLREIGYWLHPSATGRGVATRTARALSEQAFRLPGVDLVEIVHDAANVRSGAVPARVGFTAYERRPHAAVAPAETGEDQVWRLTRQSCADERQSSTRPPA
ncbi:GNAT family N-acetyltransferase [Streptomyces sp. NPDC048111]|uniref:GNAT family N-acetyltransferase n=1 Tax=Streptomyces sp. NPDC048111 TaxID=3365500 RepID=UPI00371D4916